jgi:FkbM family methyltransferase
MIFQFKNFLRKIPIIKRVYPSIIFKILKKIKKNKIVYKFRNIFLSLDIDEPMDRSIFFFDYYENNQLDFLKFNIENNKFDYFFDIGANSGLYSLYVASLDKNIKILAFEPIKRTFLNLKKNIKLNKLRNISIYNFGLSNNNQEKKVKALKKNNYIQSGGFGVVNEGENTNNLHIEKAIFKIADQKFNFYKKNIFIKIDVEGHEIYVIEGIKKLIKNNNVFLQIEIFKNNYNKVLRKLKSLKLKKIHEIRDDTKRDYFFKK